MQKGATILIVDDEEEIGFMLKMMLEHKGFAVIVTNRAEPVEEILKNNQVDLVVLDMLIAGVKGTDVCASLKENAATAHIPVLMITALPDAESVCRLAGADDFVSKPFEMAEILFKVNHLTQKMQKV